MQWFSWNTTKEAQFVCASYYIRVVSNKSFYCRLRDDRIDASEAKDRLYYDPSRSKDNYVNGKIHYFIVTIAVFRGVWTYDVDWNVCRDLKYFLKDNQILIFIAGTSSGTSNHSPVLNLSQNSTRGGGGGGNGLNSNDASGSEGNYNDGPDDDYTDDDDDDRDQGIEKKLDIKKLPVTFYTKFIIYLRDRNFLRQFL